MIAAVVRRLIACALVTLSLRPVVSLDAEMMAPADCSVAAAVLVCAVARLSVCGPVSSAYRDVDMYRLLA